MTIQHISNFSQLSTDLKSVHDSHDTKLLTRIKPGWIGWNIPGWIWSSARSTKHRWCVLQSATKLRSKIWLNSVEKVREDLPSSCLSLPFYQVKKKHEKF